MADSKTRQETLHQRASALYLQGDFPGALAVWRELLELDPADERALEGTRLCEMLVEDLGAGAANAPHSRPAPQAPPPIPVRAETAPAPVAPTPPPSAQAGGGLPPDLDDALDEIDEILGGNAPAPPRAPAPEAPPTPAAAPGGDAEPHFDLSDLGSAGPGPTRSPAAPSASGDDFSFSFGEGIDRPEREPDEAAGRRAAEVAAEELKRRTGELMAEAADLFGQGRHDEALGVVERLLILDDENESAQQFADHIRAQMEAAAAPVVDAVDEALAFEPPPDDASAEPTLNHEPFEFDEREALGVGAAVPRSSPAPAPDPASAGAVAADDILLDPDEGILDEGTAAETPKARPRPRRAPVLEEPAAGSQKRNARLLGIAAAVLLLGGAAWLTLPMLGGGADPEPEVAPPAAAVAPKPAAKGKGRAKPAAKAPAPAPAPAAAPVEPRQPPADPAAALAEARRAFEAGDYGAAVVAYDQVLLADPDNAEARDRLLVAGAKYKEQRQALEQRAAAIRSFQQGDFREALRLFYRLPAEGDAKAELDRFKHNGWYNLGVQALSGGDCRSAKENLTEARNLVGDDPDVARALGLVEACRSSSRPQSYYDAVRGLPRHGLGD